MIASTNDTKVDYNTSFGTLYDGFEQSVDLPNKQINYTFSSESTYHANENRATKGPKRVEQQQAQRESSNKQPKQVIQMKANFCQSNNATY